MKSKLLKKIRNEVYIDVPPLNNQCKDTFILLISTYIIVTIFYFSRIYEKGSQIPFQSFFVFLFPIMLLGVYAYGFTKKYVFDLNRQQVMVYGSNFFVSYTKVFCPFKKIATIEIKRKIYERRKSGNLYYYCLVFTTKEKPNDYIELVTTNNLSFNLNLNDLDQMGYELAEIFKCNFKQEQQREKEQKGNTINNFDLVPISKENDRQLKKL